MKWISVKEELAELDKDILVCDKEKTIKKGFRAYKDCYYLDSGEKSQEIKDVTDWIYLDDIPKPGEYEALRRKYLLALRKLRNLRKKMRLTQE